MRIPRKFNDRLREHTTLYAVWPPGADVALGSIMQYIDGTLLAVDHADSFDLRFSSGSPRKDFAISFQSRGVSTTILQGGAQVGLDALDLSVDAELVVKFSEENSYLVRTPELEVIQIPNPRQVGLQTRGKKGWNRTRFFFAHALYVAEDFVFLGSETAGTEIRFKGAGSGIQGFMRYGASGEVVKASSGDIGVDIRGKRGPIAIGAVRFKRNGEIRA